MANVEETILRITQQIAGPSITAALDKIEAQIKAEQRALGGLEGKIASATGKLKGLQEGLGGKVDISGVRKAQAELAKLQAQAADKSAGIGKLTDAKPLARQADAQKAAALASKKAAMEHKAAGAALVQAAQAAGGPVGSVVGHLSALKAIAGAGGAAGIVMLLTAAVVGAVAAFLAYGIAAADAARSSRLLSEAVTGSAAGGRELEAVVGDLASRVPMARAKLADMARELVTARLQSRNMQLALSAMATVASVAGDGGAAKIRQIAEASAYAQKFMLGARDRFGEFASLQGTGIKAADIYAALAASMKVSLEQAKTLLDSGGVTLKQGLEALDTATQMRFGATLAAQMRSLGPIADKLGESVRALFEGADIEPFLEALKHFADLLSQNSVIGQQLKAVIGATFSGVGSVISAVAPIAQAFFEGMILAGLALAIAFLKAKRALATAFGGDSKATVDWIGVAVNAGKVAALALGAAFVVAAASIAVAVGPMLLLWSVVLKGYNIVKNMGWSALGGWIVDGIIGGFTKAAGLLVSSVSGIGELIKSVFTEKLAIRSPSRVFEMYGRYTAEGYAQGIDKGDGRVEEAVSSMSNARPVASGRMTSSGDTYSFTIVAPGPGGGAFAERVRQVVMQLFEEASFEGPTPA